MVITWNKNKFKKQKNISQHLTLNNNKKKRLRPFNFIPSNNRRFIAS